MVDGSKAHTPIEADEITSAWARERPGMPVDAMATVTRVWQLAKVFGDQRRRIIAAGGADQATLDLLSVLRRAGPPYELAPGDIARRAMVTAGAISQRLTRAEQAGLVERDRIPGARHGVVRLLPAGHDLVDRLVGSIAELDATLLAALDPSQRDTLDQLLRVLLADAEHRFGPQPVTQVGAEPAHRSG
ncbi:MarR family winged helix-turn-helix transcriptional regulator [Pseudonocardia sp. TRM90224]|uniref:MarR family winged helix-turn-helix transcriptional regulator n=1 Tax=Pseudonocardia sp. TRM90224 TaxID=2812678 RepID=UPI001E2FE5A4|nr:MarR family transcriptional regulator [Pseudonocardia sp. TRM90224]